MTGTLYAVVLLAGDGHTTHSILQTNGLLIDRASGCPNRVQGAHQIQDFTEAVPRSGVILIGDRFFAGRWPCFFL